MKRVLIALIVIAGIAGFAVKHKPTITYWAGRVEAVRDRIGWVAGESVFQLPVPMHRQEHSLSCELASLKMALAGVGVNIPEQELVNAMPFSEPYVKYSDAAGTVWGDPHAGFVGSIDGSMSVTGYGVLWEPVAKVGLRYVHTESMANATLRQVLGHVEAGRPVVVWGYYGDGQRLAWRTPAGTPVTAVHGEHARVLVGWTGPIDSPTDIILMDPIYGELHWSVAEFMENWTALDRGAVVVYRHARWIKTADSDLVWEVSSDNRTRRALDMSWETFIQGGGVGEGIRLVSELELEGYKDEGAITAFSS